MSKTTKALFLLLLGSVLAAVALLGSSSSSRKPQSVSLIQLLASPEKYHGRFISVCGYYHHEFESSAVYLSKDDATYRIIENSVWLGSAARNADTNRIHKLNDLYVRVEGAFTHCPNGGGHLSSWSSELNDITLLTALPAE
jgi:hypothetical protein